MMDEMESVFSNHSGNHDAEIGVPEPAKLGLRVGNSGDVVRELQTPGKTMYDQPIPSSLVNSSPPSKGSHKTEDGDKPQPRHGAKMSAVINERVVTEAQNLCRELEDVVTNLRARQEESDVSSPLHHSVLLRSDNDVSISMTCSL